MDRPTQGPVNPNERATEPDRVNGSAPDDAWTNALSALRDMARRHEPASPSAGERPASPPPEPAPAPPVDEALAALQVLARRYKAGAAQASLAHPGQEPVEPQSDLEPIEPEQAEFEPHPTDFDDPSPSVHMLHRKRPSWASLALILISAAVLAVLLVGALSLWRQLFHGRDVAADRPPPPAAGEDLGRHGAAPSASSGTLSSSSVVVAVAPPTANGSPDLRAIEKAMADCDVDAAKNRDALYFLIVPAVSLTKDYTLWAPLSVGDIGTSVILLRSKDALDGLRNGSLSVYSAPYKFSIINSANETAYDWPKVTGVAKFSKLDAADIAGFRVRFGFADFVGDTPSNFRFPRDKGVCYWVSALLRT